MQRPVPKPTYYTRISAKHRLFDLQLEEVWRYRDLIWLFTKRSFTVKYKQTILGPLWLLLSPLLTSVIYVVLFGNIAKLSTGGVPQLLFYLTGTAVWGFFSTILTSNAGVFVNNADLFGKVYFPRLTIPISNVLSSFLQFCIQIGLAFLLLILECIFGAVHPHWIAWLYLPLVLLELSLMALGFGILISSLTTKYRDLSVLVNFGVTLWLYASPVVYPLQQLSDGWLKVLLECNPVSAPLEAFRYAVLGVGTVPIGSLLLSIFVTLLVLGFGVIIFHRVERNFMDTV